MAQKSWSCNFYSYDSIFLASAETTKTSKVEMMMTMITSATSKEILTADVTQQEGIEFVAMMISKLWANCELLKWERIRHFIFRNRRNCKRGTCCSECEDEDDRSCNLCDDRERDCRQLKSKRLFNNKFSRSRTQKLLFEVEIVKVNTVTQLWDICF